MTIAYKKCPHCFGEINPRATACPHCRQSVVAQAPPPKKKRRELGLLGLALVSGGVCTAAVMPDLGFVPGAIILLLGAFVLIFALFGGHVKLLG